MFAIFPWYNEISFWLKVLVFVVAIIRCKSLYLAISNSKFAILCTNPLLCSLDRFVLLVLAWSICSLILSYCTINADKFPSSLIPVAGEVNPFLSLAILFSYNWSLSNAFCILDPALLSIKFSPENTYPLWTLFPEDIFAISNLSFSITPFALVALAIKPVISCCEFLRKLTSTAPRALNSFLTLSTILEAETKNCLPSASNFVLSKICSVFIDVLDNWDPLET